MSTPPTPPEVSPAWWLHILTVAIAAAGFVAAAIHPGYKIPPVVAASVGSLCVVLAGVSTACVWLEHHSFAAKAIPQYVAALERWGASTGFAWGPVTPASSTATGGAPSVAVVVHPGDVG